MPVGTLEDVEKSKKFTSNIFAHKASKSQGLPV
jgi:hypothetical protein